MKLTHFWLLYSEFARTPTRCASPPFMISSDTSADTHSDSFVHDASCAGLIFNLYHACSSYTNESYLAISVTNREVPLEGSSFFMLRFSLFLRIISLYYYKLTRHAMIVFLFRLEMMVEIAKEEMPLHVF